MWRRRRRIVHEKCDKYIAVYTHTRCQCPAKVPLHWPTHSLRVSPRRSIIYYADRERDNCLRRAAAICYLRLACARVVSQIRHVYSEHARTHTQQAHRYCRRNAAVRGRFFSHMAIWSPTLWGFCLAVIWVAVRALAYTIYHTRNIFNNRLV